MWESRENVWCRTWVFTFVAIIKFSIMQIQTPLASTCNKIQNTILMLIQKQHLNTSHHNIRNKKHISIFNKIQYADLSFAVGFAVSFARSLILGPADSGYTPSLPFQIPTLPKPKHPHSSFHTLLTSKYFFDSFINYDGFLDSSSLLFSKRTWFEGIEPLPEFLDSIKMYRYILLLSFSLADCLQIDDKLWETVCNILQHFNYTFAIWLYFRLHTLL